MNKASLVGCGLAGNDKGPSGSMCPYSIYLAPNVITIYIYREGERD